MSITIYNTLTRSKQLFTTLAPEKVTMYCCGVTVYDDCHLGHARSYIGWDVVRRYLQWRGYQVRYVQNFTEMAITAAENGWQTLKDALTLDWQKLDLAFGLSSGDFDANAIDQFQTAMDDDFNTAAGLAVLFELAKSLKREFNLRCYEGLQELSEIRLQQKSQTLIQLAQVFGLEVQAQAQPELEIDPIWIESLLQQRQQARAGKRYAESDRIRDQLLAVGITPIDRPDGQTRYSSNK
jgi:cysteinyl-tRNA synthetase